MAAEKKCGGELNILDEDQGFYDGIEEGGLQSLWKAQKSY